MNEETEMDWFLYFRYHVNITNKSIRNRRCN